MLGNSSVELSPQYVNTDMHAACQDTKRRKPENAGCLAIISSQKSSKE